MWGWITLAGALVGGAYVIIPVLKENGVKDTIANAKAIYHVASFKLLKDFVIFRSRLAFQELSDCGKYIVNKTTCEMTFYDGAQRYKIVFPRKRGPSCVVKVMHGAGAGFDVTNEVVELMGPCHNFYGIPVSPAMLRFPDGLTFEMIGGETQTFGKNEVIELM